jgi:SulP family sulfate permease
VTAAETQLPKTSFAELYAPKLLTVLREGYGWHELRADAVAGITVAIVALPLSMAIAIAAGTTPDRGLYTAIVGGFLVSLLGGSRFQIGGPAGAFIVLMALTVERHGLQGLLLATILSGAILALAGFLKLGTYVKYIPFPVTVGFTAAIALIIFASQIHDLFGLTLPGKEPGPVILKLAALAAAAPSANPAATAVGAATIGIILALKRWRPRLPGFLIAIALASIAAALLGLPVETIASRFGGIPQSPPLPHLPPLSLHRIAAVLPDAFSFALLGSIESLLSASVADGMTGRRHRSNCELVAQGVANIASGLFGGIPVTGTIARTATNVRAGAHGPIAGMIHSAALLAFILIAAPLAGYIPLAALAGVLVLVAWNMIEKEAIAALLRSSDVLALLSTFTLTVFRDLTEGILVGFAISSILFLNRMAKAVSVETHLPMTEQDTADSAERGEAYAAGLQGSRDEMVFRISGAFFFGAASTVGAVLDRIAEWPKVFVFDFSQVPVIDSTGARVIEGFAKKLRRHGTMLIVAGAPRAVRHELWTHGVRPPLVRFKRKVSGFVGKD